MTLSVCVRGPCWHDGRVTESVPPDQVRVTDADRKVVEQRLREAHDNGSLDLNELDERLGQVWRSKTRADLATVTADLPVPEPEPREVSWTKRGGGYVAMRVLGIIWASATAFNLMIWLLIAVSTGNYSLYPWWIWVGIPPGAVLGVLWLSGVGRPKRR
jgi:hypothetical protein